MFASPSDRLEVPFFLEGDAHFLGVVFETIDAHLDRDLAPYEGLIVGVDSVDAGPASREADDVIRVYVEMEADDDPDDVIDDMDDLLDKLADTHDMVRARQSVQVTYDETALEPENGE